LMYGVHVYSIQHTHDKPLQYPGILGQDGC
jgi:hypothetical protein